jgi:O-antigen/teichoic acid export membrane protein
MSLKQKGFNAASFTLISFIINNFLSLLISVFLSRLLLPSDYGLIGMVAIFISFSELLINGGFVDAIIVKKNVSDIDLSTVFIYNLFASILLYLILYFSANSISLFFQEPKVLSIIRVIGLNIIINSFSVVNRAKLNRDLKFKALSIIRIISVIISGFTGIFLALSNFGVWSLVFMSLVNSSITTLLFSIATRMRLKLIFDLNSFKDFFKFSYKILLTAFLASLYNNLYNFIFGKFYSTSILGYYSKANNLKDIVSSPFSNVVLSVGYPILATFNDDRERLSNALILMLKNVSYISFPLILGLISISDSLIVFLFGSQWSSMVPYFNVLLLSIIFFPHNSLNLSLLKIIGRSDLFLILDIYKILIGLSILGFSVLFNLGINGLFFSILITSLFAFLVNNVYSKSFFNYGLCSQIKDFFPFLILSLLMFFAINILDQIFVFIPIIDIILFPIFGAFVYFGLSFILRIKEFYFYFNQVYKFLSSHFSNRNK